MIDARQNDRTAERGAAERPAPSILLVDDRRENLMALEAILEPLGHRLVKAESGTEALRCVLHEQFAVILLDVEMPGTGGLETARLIKQRSRSEHVPIIFLTALTQDRRQVSLGYESGAVDYLFKPIDPQLLRAKVAAFVELDQLREALSEQQGRRFADLAVRESEERFRLVQKATNDVIRDWDLVTDVVRWNGIASSALGMRAGEPSDDVRWWLDHVHPEDRRRVDAGIQVAIKGADGAAWSTEYRFRLGNGSYRTFLDRAYVVRDSNGEPVRMIGAMQDVTERVEMREAAAAAQADAERARESAEAASRLKSEFLATMSHEFRTPLNAIIGYAQLLDMGVLGPATPAQHAHLERLQGSARHLLRLVEDVLDVAKVDADRLLVRHDALMTGASIVAAMTLVQPLAASAGICLLDCGASKHGVPFVGDEHRVRQVLVNLLTNALKFTPAGGAVTVESGAAAEPDPMMWRRASDGEPKQEEATGSWVYVRITDSGPGIAAQLMDQLFEPFTQGDSALTREQGGTGLGLAISRRLARLMGGDVTVRTEAGKGSAFTLWLPGPREMAGTQDPAALHPPREAPAMGSTTVTDAVRDELDASAYAVVQTLGERLAAQADTVTERLVAALRADRRFPQVHELPAVQLRDHVTPLIGLLATQLMIIGETHGEAPELLADGGHLHRLMAELHGAQRHRIGWAESDIERETSLLLAEIYRVFRSAAGDTGASGDGASSVAPHAMRSVATIRSATEYAVSLSRDLLERATRTSVRSHRFSKAASAP